MDTPSSSQTAFAADEWELCSEDGFIYKREKRGRVLIEPASAPADPEEEEQRRREWKRKSLLRVKEKYKKEIEEWVVLSKTLKEMQEKALRFQVQQQERRKLRKTEEEQRTASFSRSEIKDKDNAYGSSVDELLLQAEAQDMIIRDVSNLCDIGEKLCDAQEEQLKQSYFDLPIWASPRDLMASLCDDCQLMLYQCGDNIGVPLLGLRGSTGYASLMVRRHYGVEQFIPMTYKLS
ncbi:uncharacterized protein LOC111278417 [Durio zibethinus]|uniref:Uncharacterized protein LOC111278417 n=1 Tax=Durio zibethinus TaxID=66656 RepID=A0A6P5WXD7_DURZI|nr:uncharacterized protein LOC111278417 [Durio zibethinus]